jgi:hypothetical protein
MQARRYTGPGVIVQDGRKIVVECFYEVMSTESGVDWHGEFRGAAAGEEPEPGEAEFRAEGKSGQVIIVGVTAGLGRGRFQGSGPAPG